MTRVPEEIPINFRGWAFLTNMLQNTPAFHTLVFVAYLCGIQAFPMFLFTFVCGTLILNSP
jgi:hypothetical protein